MIEYFSRLIQFVNERTRYRCKQIGSSIRYVNMFIVFLKSTLYIYLHEIDELYLYGIYITRMFIFAFSPIIINA